MHSSIFKKSYTGCPKKKCTTFVLLIVSISGVIFGNFLNHVPSKVQSNLRMLSKKCPKSLGVQKQSIFYALLALFPWPDYILIGFVGRANSNYMCSFPWPIRQWIRIRRGLSDWIERSNSMLWFELVSSCGAFATFLCVMKEFRRNFKRSIPTWKMEYMNG